MRTWPSGLLSSCKSGFVRRIPRMVTKTAPTMPEIKAVSTARRTFASSFAPTNCETRIVKPRASPEKSETSKKFMIFVLPTAASASSPTKWPTTMESTRLYICCKRLPASKGSENLRIREKGFPSVIVFMIFLQQLPCQIA